MIQVSNIEPYRGRSIDQTKPVEVYRCLNRSGRVFSVRQKGKVVGHTTDKNIYLRDCKFVVNEAGRARALRDKQRNVHGFIRGMLAPFQVIMEPARIMYDPLKYGRFFVPGEILVTGAPVVAIGPSGVYMELSEVENHLQ